MFVRKVAVTAQIIVVTLDTFPSNAAYSGRLAFITSDASVIDPSSCIVQNPKYVLALLLSVTRLLSNVPQHFNFVCTSVETDDGSSVTLSAIFISELPFDASNNTQTIDGNFVAHSDDEPQTFG
jgi:hypothetical protein